jgi:2-polyprenyl-6-methoxyphenol hydroxylase-like FAD-dependent oxidoreductase
MKDGGDQCVVDDTERAVTDSISSAGREPEGNGEQAGVRPAVLVVGAGPTGLLLASELQRRGVSCHLIDSRSGPMHWDRATVVHPRSLEIFESLGVEKKFLDAGCRQRRIKIHSGGSLLGTMELSSCGSSYGFNVGLSEEVTESILTEYLEQMGGKVNRSSRLVGLTQQGDGVVAEIEGEGGRYQVNARWVVGCDGLHSPTRELSGIGFEGHDILKPWAVFDATLEGWTDTYEATFVYFGAHPTIFTAIPGRRWRVYLRPSSPESDLVEDASSVLRVYAPAASFVDVENPTRFHCHTKVATGYRSGPVFLAGDAAHLCSPAQGHGMNCGLQDAFNLAWKLALVHHGDADASLLDSYEAERKPAAELVNQSGDEFERALTMTDAAECEERDRAIAAMIADPTARQHEIVAEMELNVDYSGSPIIFGDGNFGDANKSLAAGGRLPDTVRVQWRDGSSHGLHKLAHRAGHTLMLLAGPRADDRAFADLHAALQEVATGSPLFDAAVGLGTRRDLSAEIGYLEPDAADLLGVEGNTLLAMRPDGYIGLRADRGHMSALERYSALVLGGHC